MNEDNLPIVEIKIVYEDYNNVDARAYYNGEQIDSHIHSSETWLLRDWGLCGYESNMSKSHDMKILEKTRLNEVRLIYKNKERIIKKS